MALSRSRPTTPSALKPPHMPRRPPWRQAVLEPFVAFLRLGLSSFGGPIAHLGYFRQEFVERRQWLSEQTFMDLVALCQFLPGPTSSQVCYSIGMLRGGIPGALAGWKLIRPGSSPPAPEPFAR